MIIKFYGDLEDDFDKLKFDLFSGTSDEARSALRKILSDGPDFDKYKNKFPYDADGYDKFKAASAYSTVFHGYCFQFIVTTKNSRAADILTIWKITKTQA